MGRIRGLVLIAALCSAFVCTHADDHTYVVNKADVGVLVTTSYGSGDSEFVNRDIEPGAQGDLACQCALSLLCVS